MKEAISGLFMFIRFVSGEIDEDSRVSAGLFGTVLRWSEGLPAYEIDAIEELMVWFDAHLRSPFDYLPDHCCYDPAICWFRSTAREHLAKAWELVAILERNDVLIWTIRSPRTGYVYYEDDVQVFARPYHDLKRLL